MRVAGLVFFDHGSGGESKAGTWFSETYSF